MEWLLVGVGGASGAIGRYWLGSVLLPLSKSLGFPINTLVINMIGCLLIGLYFGLHPRGFPEESRLLLVVGFLGGFTTFSAFGYETFELIVGGAIGLALINAVFQCAVGVGLVWAGAYAAKWL